MDLNPDYSIPDMISEEDFLQQIIDANVLPDALKDEPHLEILIQPAQRGYRFRYHSEGNTHGGIPGEGSEKGRKKFPTVHIANYRGKAAICITLVTADDPAEVHAHNLVGKGVQNGMYYYEDNKQEWVASFQNLGIQHVTKKDLVNVLHEKLLQSYKLNLFAEKEQMTQSFDISALVDSFGAGETSGGFVDEEFAKIMEEEENKKIEKKAKKMAKEIDPSAVRLCFQAFLPDEHGKLTTALAPVISQPIYDAKAAHAGQLRICRVSKSSSSVTGGEEVFLLCDKVQKDDIAIRFYLEDQNGRMQWADNGVFTPADVHKQCAIVFKTPPYQDRAIQRPVTVKMHLVRKKDLSDCSEPIEFIYKPEEFDKYKIGEKRRKGLPENLKDILTKSGLQFGSQSTASASSSSYDDDSQGNLLCSGIKFFKAKYDTQIGDLRR